MKPRGLDKVFSMLIPPAIADYIKFVETNLSERMKQENHTQGSNKVPARKDMFHYLFHAKDTATGEPGYNSVELYEDIDMLTVAGSDTTSAVFSAMFFYLIHNPQALQNLEHEIHTTFKNIDDVKLGPKLSACTYLRAVIDESLRMSPPGSSDMLREVLPGGLKVQGTDEVIPTGTNVGTPIYALHHDPEIFPQPFSFRPERWISESSENQNQHGVSHEGVQQAENSFFPFLIGTRGCPGKGLARMELSVIFARLLFRYEFRGVSVLPDARMGEGNPAFMWGRRNRGQFQTKDAMVPLRDGPVLQFRKRV